MILSVPSKTFLIGEYGVLEGGPALVLGTEPRFELHILPFDESSRENSYRVFHPESPAGRLYSLYEKSLSQMSFRFVDPHFGGGGLGASSAQFVLLYSYIRKALGSNEAFNNLQTDDELFLMLDTYKKLATTTSGRTPSGYDVLCQMMGGLTYICSDKRVVERMHWPLKGFGFSLFKTGQKVSTHQHLDSLEKTDFDTLKKISTLAIEQLLSQRAGDFFESVSVFKNHLRNQNLTALTTSEVLNQFDQCEEVLASKGCGALGADVILVFFAEEDRSAIRKFGLELGLVYIGDEKSLSSGLMINSFNHSEVSL